MQSELAGMKERAIRANLLQVAYTNNIANVGVNLLAGTALVFMLLSAGVNQILLAAWMCALIILSAWRIHLTYTVLGTSDDFTSIPDAKLARWEFLYSLGLLVAVCLWIVITGATFTTDQPDLQHAVVMIISALAAGATGILAAQVIIGRIYITLMLTSGSLFLIVGENPQYILSLLGVAFAVVMLVLHRNNHRALREALMLKFSNRELVDELTSERQMLEHRVDRRTAELKRLSERDSLTGLLNRRGIDAWIADRCATDDVSKQYATIIIDLDRFKQINDGLGHAAGDRVLTKIAERLAKALPVDAALGRWGGDEFAAILPLGEDLSLEGCHELIRNMRGDVERAIAVDGMQIHVGFSAGLAVVSGERDLLLDSIRSADLAASEVKRKGRGGVQLYSSEMFSEQQRTLLIGQKIKDALDAGEFSIAIQPIVDAGTLEVDSYEILARWESPTLGRVRPEEFIPIAEDLGEIVGLGAYILETALSRFAAEGLAGGKAKLAINVSLRQLVWPSFADFLLTALKKHGVKPQSMVVEVTESVFDPENRVSIGSLLEKLSHEGIDIHVDDFGSGYSSLSRLREMPIAALKIDQTFVRQMDEQSIAIIEGTVHIARKFGIKTIAEGVETAEHAVALQNIGVDCLQGYLFGRPQSEFSHLGGLERSDLTRTGSLDSDAA
ncbi:putative bifunctional diguanylate cyclase/phosphodiesterase [Hoeflea sp.]|uniref:putative bifunctional diguanylate cyclase/phosphodiesterase n=1 Tax=Hoeflea sp. TaxID=1940281 RepID=UPI003B52E8D4